jgi:hypothetical protein
LKAQALLFAGAAEFDVGREVIRPALDHVTFVAK